MKDEDLSDALDALDLDLDSSPRWPPWGLVAAAAHGPVADSQPPDTELEDQAVREGVRKYCLLTRTDLSSDESLRQLEEDVKAATTDPFYCVESANTYSISHLQLPQELEGRRAFLGRFPQGGSLDSVVLSDERIWYINPRMATVTFRAQMDALEPEESDRSYLEWSHPVRREGGQLLLANITLLLKKVTDWKVHIVAHSIAVG